MAGGRPRGSKGGTVYYDEARQRYIVQYYIIDPKTHAEKRAKKSFEKEDEAREYLNTMQYQKGNEIFIKNNGIPLNQLMRSIQKRKLDMNVISETQYARVLKTIAVIEKSPMVKKKIEDITSDDIQDYLNSLTDYSNSYIKKIVEQFNQSYKMAMNKGYITRNPMIDVITPRSNKKDKVIRAMTVEEQQKFTQYLMSKTAEEEPYKNAFLIQMYCGLRIGETLALRDTDIDLQRNLLSVTKTITTDKDGKAVMGDSTKTYAGIREIPIPEYIRDCLMEQMEIAKENRDRQLFLSSNGRYIDGRNANRILKKRLKEIGIEGFSTHSLRHTYGTRCVEAGMRAVALQRLMGHTDVSVTLNTYTSVFNKYKESELQKVNDYYLNNQIFSPSSLLEENQKLLNALEVSEKEDKEYE